MFANQNYHWLRTEFKWLLDDYWQTWEIKMKFHTKKVQKRGQNGFLKNLVYWATIVLKKKKVQKPQTQRLIEIFYVNYRHTDRPTFCRGWFFFFVFFLVRLHEWIYSIRTKSAWMINKRLANKKSAFKSQISYLLAMVF